jgi:hypothetical protein
MNFLSAGAPRRIGGLDYNGGIAADQSIPAINRKKLWEIGLRRFLAFRGKLTGVGPRPPVAVCGDETIGGVADEWGDDEKD